MDYKKPLLALALIFASGMTQAGEKEELLKLRNTTTNLIKQLVKQGILNEKTANDMIKQADADADKQVAETKKIEAKDVVAKEAVPVDEVRVSYVPDFVKDEIRQQVRTELREDVVGDVMQKAKKEQWGIPAALPEWVRKFRLSGDMRIREQSSFYASDNYQNSPPNTTAYYDWLAVNANQAENLNTELNINNNQNQGRERVRLGIDVDIAENVAAGMRLATGNIRNPVSTNQTMGNYDSRYDFNIDRAFLKYSKNDDHKFNWLTVMAGRTPNPFFTGGSELVWDEDLSFEGAFVSARHRLSSSDLTYSLGGKGPTVFTTAGLFPLQSASGLSSRDKWLYGGQAGVDWGLSNQDIFQLAGSYYSYQNLQAVTNSASLMNAKDVGCNTNTAEQNQSAPQYMQFGNTLTSICNNADGRPGLVGLASGYNILNINTVYDSSFFAPTHIKLSADYAKNLNYNTDRFNSIIVNGVNGLPQPNQSYNGQTNAYQVRTDIGWPKFDSFGKWSVFTYYKYVERDAVLDAFTDSDFHLGGTNVKGWTIGGNYGLVKNVWLTGRWLSGNVISGAQYGVDVMQLDLNTRF
jgi:Putative porin